MSFAVPEQIQYANQLPVLPPETVNTSVVISPSNGNSFTPSGNNQLIFDLGSSGFLDPATVSLRYKLNVTNATTAQTLYGGGYGVLGRLEVFFGSTIVETVNNYNIVYADMVNLTYNFAQKQSLACSYGFLDKTTVPDSQNTNGLDIPIAGGDFFIAIPLVSILSQCEKMLPLFSMSAVRVVLTLDTISNAFSGSTITAYTITNAEIGYDMVRFGSGVESLVRSMGEKIYIKSQSMTFTGSSLSSGSSGNVSLIFNQRLSSVKGLLAHFASLDNAKALSKNFDSVDITQNNGSFQFYVNSIPYPSRAIDVLNNRSVAMSELRHFIAGIHNVQSSNTSITPREWNTTIATTTSLDNVGKFFIATNTEKIQDGKNALLSGISTSNSPISLTMNIGTATPNAVTVLLLVIFDVLIEVDTTMRTASVKI